MMLTKLSLWINSAMKDEPFATIHTHLVRCGNSLVCGLEAGFRLADFEKELIPSEHRELKKLRKALSSMENPAQDDRPLIGALDAIIVHRQLREASSRLDDAKIAVSQEFSENCVSSGPAFKTPLPSTGKWNSPRCSKIAAASMSWSAMPPGARTCPALAITFNPAHFDWRGNSTKSYRLFIELALRLLRD